MQLALEKAQAERKEKNAIINSLKSKLASSDELAKRQDAEILALRKQAALLQQSIRSQELTVEKLRSEHTLDLERALTEAQRAQQVQLRTLEQTEETRAGELKAQCDVRVSNILAGLEDRLSAQQKAFDQRLAEMQARHVEELRRVQTSGRREVETMRASEQESTEEMRQLREQLESIQTGYGDITVKTAKLVQAKIAAFEREKQAALTELKAKHTQATDLQNEKIALLKSTYDSSFSSK